jgi:uncharacterized SAM-binding protein YcdF (DUF218 family)
MSVEEGGYMQEVVFVIQKIFLSFIFPVSIALFLGLGAILLWRRPRAAFWLVLACFAWLLVTSLPLTGKLLIRTLENTAGPYADPNALTAARVRYVVVLSGEFRQGDLTPGDRVGCSMVRLVEGIRLWRATPDTKLVVTGGRIPGLSEDMSIAEALADVAHAQGVPREAIILEADSWTTEDQARLVAAIIGKEPFALVTSAYHMPRSLMLFRFAGLDPIPAPADYLSRKITLDYSALVPQAGGLALTEIAVREYAAKWLLAAKIRIARRL